MDRPSATSGAQHDIVAGPVRATVTEVGASLRRLEVDGVPLVRPWAPDEIRPVYSGAVLAPWPNRLGDGAYRWDGATRQLPLDEPDKRTALHGLVAWERWELLGRTDASVTLVHRLVPRPGYPFPLTLEITYVATGAGLSVSLVARNEGSVAAPYGAGMHPYLVADGEGVDDWELTLDAGTVLDVDDRGLPTGKRQLDELDFRVPRRLRDLRVDHAFTELGSGPDDGRALELRGRDGNGVAVRLGEGCRWMQVFTGDLPEIGRTGLAVEPMTCPPDAFRTGEDLVRLEPGGRHRLAYDISCCAAPS